MTTKNNPVAAIFESCIEAETAVKELQSAGFDIKKFSIVGRDYHTDFWSVYGIRLILKSASALQAGVERKFEKVGKGK